MVVLRHHGDHDAVERFQERTKVRCSFGGQNEEVVDLWWIYHDVWCFLILISGDVTMIYDDFTIIYGDFRHVTDQMMMFPNTGDSTNTSDIFTDELWDAFELSKKWDFSGSLRMRSLCLETNCRTSVKTKEYKLWILPCPFYFHCSTWSNNRTQRFANAKCTFRPLQAFRSYVLPTLCWSPKIMVQNLISIPNCH